MAEWKSRLPRISAEIADNIDRAMAQGAELVAQRAKQRVPVETGRLRAAIHVERNNQADYSVLAGGPVPDDRDVFYGHIVEHGGVHQPAQPFLVPALNDMRKEIDKLVAEALPE